MIHDKITPKKFMELLQKAVDDGKITEDEKENYEFKCAYVQKETPSRLNNKMCEILKKLCLI